MSTPEPAQNTDPSHRGARIFPDRRRIPTNGSPPCAAPGWRSTDARLPACSSGSCSPPWPSSPWRSPSSASTTTARSTKLPQPERSGGVHDHVLSRPARGQRQQRGPGTHAGGTYKLDGHRYNEFLPGTACVWGQRGACHCGALGPDAGLTGLRRRHRARVGVGLRPPGRIARRPGRHTRRAGTAVAAHQAGDRSHETVTDPAH